MAGLHAHFGSADPQRLNAAAQALTFGPETRVDISDGAFHCVWIGHDQAAEHGPAWDPGTGVRVVTAGRAIAAPATKRQDIQGGSVPAALLDRYLNGGRSALDDVDGACIVLVWDPREQTAHLWTDAFGYHPAFLYRPDTPSACVVSTFADAIARDPATSVSWDTVSMAEFLRAWRATPPHTYYREVKHAGAATRWSWDLRTGACSTQRTWTPFQKDFFRSRTEASEHLAEAVRAAIGDRTGPSAEPVACFISGGADSRVLLFGAVRPEGLVGINLFDEPNPETDTARALCTAAGVPFVQFQRDRDYYPRLLNDIVRWSGGMWSAEDAHYLGTHETVGATGARTVMTACTTDWLFKGYGLEKTSRTLFGRALPVSKLTRRRIDGFLPNVATAAPPELAAAIHERLAAWFAGTPDVLASDRDWLEVEDRRVRPACYAVSVSGPIMYRVFPYDTFLADTRIANCYDRIRPRWKLDGHVWGLAAARICREAGHVVDANHGWSLGASAPARIGAFARGWVRRKMQRLLRSHQAEPDGPATGSWPNYGWYVRHSPTIRDWWPTVSEDHRQRLAHVCGEDPWKRPLAQWSADAARFFRAATLLHHWAQNEPYVGHPLAPGPGG